MGLTSTYQLVQTQALTRTNTGMIPRRASGVEALAHGGENWPSAVAAHLFDHVWGSAVAGPIALGTRHTHAWYLVPGTCHARPLPHAWDARGPVCLVFGSLGTP